MKYIKKITLIIGILMLMGFGNVFAEGAVSIPTSGIEEIKKVSIAHIEGSGNIVESTNNVGFRILRTLKIILQGLLVIYVVYIGVTMIISMGTDEDKLSKSKNQLWYSLIALVFINIPGTIYDAINIDERKQKINEDGTIDFTGSNGSDIFVEGELFDGVMGSIIGFLEVFIFGVAVFVLVMAGVKIMTSRGKEEKVTEAKNKILYSIFAMIFVGMIEAWKAIAITGNIAQTDDNLFSQMINLSLLFAGPVVIFFLTFAGYTYITSNGEEEKIKKAKTIIVNTLIAILLLVVMFTFLNDLVTF